MNIVRLRGVAAGAAEFQIDYGQKRAWIKIEGLDTTGGPEEDGIPWEPFYRERLKELFDAIQADGSDWKFSGSK